MLCEVHLNNIYIYFFKVRALVIETCLTGGVQCEIKATESVRPQTP